MDLLPTVRRRFEIQVVAQAAKSSPPRAGRNKAAGDSTAEAKAAAAPKRNRDPRKQYLAPLAAEKGAAEAASATAAATAPPPADPPPVWPDYADRRRNRARSRSNRRVYYGPRTAQPKQRDQRRR